MLKHIKIAKKIYILGFSQLFLMVAMGGIALTQMAKIGVELVDIAEKNIPLASSITKLTEHQLEQSILIERALFNVALIKLSPSNIDHKHYEELLEHIDELSNTIIKEINEIQATTKSTMSTLHSQEAVDEYQSVLGQMKVIKLDANDFI